MLSFKLVGSSGSSGSATALSAEIRNLSVQAATPTSATTNSLALRIQGLNQATINNSQPNALRVWYIDDDTLYVAHSRGTAYNLTITALPAGRGPIGLTGPAGTSTDQTARDAAAAAQSDADAAQTTADAAQADADAAQTTADAAQTQAEVDNRILNQLPSGTLADAEGGTDTDRKIYTAQRIRQAIDAINPVSTITGNDGISNIRGITQAAYDALGTINDNTLYVIAE